jgi:hypothetical protein
VEDGLGRDALGEGPARLVDSVLSLLEEVVELFFLEDSDPFDVLSLDFLLEDSDPFDVLSLDFLLGATRSDMEGYFFSFASLALPLLTPSRKSESLLASQSEPL